jgi:hypothetical protein
MDCCDTVARWQFIVSAIFQVLKGKMIVVMMIKIRVMVLYISYPVDLDYIAFEMKTIIFR